MPDTELQSAGLERLLARAAIHDVQMRYCRGIDRCDVDLIRSAYWPDGVDHHGIFDGNAVEFADFVVTHLRRSLRSAHMVSNMSVAFQSQDDAEVETYVLSYAERPGDEGSSESLQGGRYLDRFNRRGEEWRILERTYVMDWNMNGPSTAQWEGRLYGRLSLRGGRWPDDPAYALIPGLFG